MSRWTKGLLAWGLLLAGNAQAQTVEYIHTDALGSVVAVTNAQRKVIERREYEPYGHQLTPAVANGPGYTGHVQDAATGLVYMQQRYYDAQIGRFLSVDPVTAHANPGLNFNRYWYANNNPYKFTDSDGRAACVIAPPAPVCIAAAIKAAKVVGAVLTVSAAGYGGYKAGEYLNESGESAAPADGGNTNPYDGPIDEPVIVVDGDGNAIPVGAGERITTSPNGEFQQVRDADGNPTGTRMDKGGHPGQSDPKAQAPHGHRPGVTDETGNSHLPLNEPKPRP